MKRFLSTLFTVYLLLAVPAQAFSVSGGTQEQRDIVREAIQAAEYPAWEWTDQRFLGGVNIEFVEHFDPYWEEPLSFDILPGAVGAAWAGEIRIMSTIEPSPWLTEIAIHEWAHEVWFALPSDANKEWTRLVAEGFPYDPAIWRQSPAEAHAEHLRVYAWEPQWYVTAEPRTDLRQLTAEQVFDFHARWIPEMTTTTTTLPPTTSTTAPPPPPTTTATTTPRGDPFKDVAREDTELWEAAWWARDSNVIRGYPDGTFRPYEPLLKHHVDLIVDRWVGIAIGGYGDYTPATRGYLWLALPGLRWDSTRMNEPLLRSQLLRLLYRGRQ